MSEVRLKKKYTIGTNQRPTIEECLSCPECEKHFHDSIKKISKYLTKEQVYDLKIDSYIYAINHYNGKSNFLTFLYMVSRQHGMKLVKKVVKEKDNFDAFKERMEFLNNKKSNGSVYTVIENTLPESLREIAIDKYVNMMSVEKICNKYSMTTNEANKTIDRIKKCFME